MPGADIWYTDAPGPQSTKLAELSLFPGNGDLGGAGGDPLSWSQDSPGYATMIGLSDLTTHIGTQGMSGVHSNSNDHRISMRFREVAVGTVNTRILSAQEHIRDNAEFDGACAATGGACHGFVEADAHGGMSNFSTTGYENNAHCTWLLICPDAGSSVVLSFSSMNTESNYDYVSVIVDGDTLLSMSGRYCSSDPDIYNDPNIQGCGDAYSSDPPLPDPVVSASGRPMLVVLSADGSSTQPGFSAHFTCTDSGAGVLAVPAGIYYSGSLERPPTAFSSAAAAVDFFRDAFPAFSIEVEESVVRDGTVVFHYGVRQWTSHYYQDYPFLHTGAGSCGVPACELERQVEMISSYRKLHGTEALPGKRETKADLVLRGVISAVSNSVVSEQAIILGSIKLRNVLDTY